MNIHTADFQTIEYDGKPAFVLVPFDIFRKIRPMLENKNIRSGIPHEVVKRNTLDDVPMIKAWREYLGMTQGELAKEACMLQPEIAKIECRGANVGQPSLIKIAGAMGLTLEQLEE